MTQRPSPRGRRVFIWGITSTILSTIGIVPLIVVFILGATVDPNYGWLLFVCIPFSLLAGGLGVVFGIIGVFAARDTQQRSVWPTIGVLIGGVQLLYAMIFFSGALS